MVIRIIEIQNYRGIIFLAGGLGELHGGAELMPDIKEWVGFGLGHGARGAALFRWKQGLERSVGLLGLWVWVKRFAFNWSLGYRDEIRKMGWTQIIWISWVLSFAFLALWTFIIKFWKAHKYYYTFSTDSHFISWALLVWGDWDNVLSKVFTKSQNVFYFIFLI